MIGRLPHSLTVCGHEYAIRTDYRVALLIFEAFNDADLSPTEKAITAVECLYTDQIPAEHLPEAIRRAYWYLDGGDVPHDGIESPRVFDWTQDAHMIFPAVNRAAGCEVRSVEPLHWWTFLGYFQAIDEGLFSTVISIRRKRATGKKLADYEKDFCRQHPNLIKLKHNLTPEEKADAEFIKQLTEG